MKTQQLQLDRKDLNQALGSGELKACPFCGAWAFSAGFQNKKTKNWVYSVTCTNTPECCVQMHACYKTMEEARGAVIKKWNRRNQEKH